MPGELESLHCPICDWLGNLEGEEWNEACELIASWQGDKQPRIVHVRSDDLRAVYNAVLDADEEGLAGHAEPMMRIAAAITR